MASWIYLLPLVGVAIFFRKKLTNILLFARYECIYWILGVLGMGDDFIHYRSDRLKELPNRSGDVVIITGGARGIGREVVKKLLQADMVVVVACRKVEAGESAIEAIRALGITSGKADVMQLDVSSLASVRQFAKGFRAKYNKLHVLINNAGVMFVPQSLSEDGFEAHMATNYFGHFLLTHLLLEPLVTAARESKKNSRVVNVSSSAHLAGSINFEDTNYKNSLYIPTQAYAQSKIAQIMFSKAADRRMKSKQFPVSFFSVHPGVVNTELFDGTPLKTIFPFAPALFFKTPERGATTILYAALSRELEGRGGEYFSNCREVWVSSTAQNTEKQEKLMKISEQLLNLKSFGSD